MAGPLGGVVEARSDVPKEIWTPADVAKYLKLSERTIYYQAKQGALPHFRVGRILRFNAADIRNLHRNGHKKG